MYWVISVSKSGLKSKSKSNTCILTQLYLREKFFFTFLNSPLDFQELIYMGEDDVDGFG